MQDEKILAIYPMDICGSGRSSFEQCDMYFTNKRMVANLTGRGLYPRFASKWLLLNPMNILASITDYTVTKPLSSTHNTGAFTDAEQILKSNKHNFAWNYQNDIKSIKMKRRGRFGLTPLGPPELIIKLGGGQQKTLNFHKQYFNELVSILRNQAGEKLIV